MKNNLNIIYIPHLFRLAGLTVFLLLLTAGCKKLVELDVVQNRTQAELVFSDASTANAAINGIYRQSKDNFPAAISFYGGVVSDELTTSSSQPQYEVYLKNQIPSTDGNNPWTGFYQVIYGCNAAIEGLSKNSVINEMKRNQYIGEAKFNRAWCYLNLVNLYGDIPLVTTTNVATNSIVSRASVDAVNQQISEDLRDAVSKLQVDYAFNGLGHARANKWAAIALLSRVNLYSKDYKAAEKNATSVINSGLYSLLNTPSGIFNKDNSESILQWENFEGETNVLTTNTSQNPPSLLITDALWTAFEKNDLRKDTWIGEITISGQTFRYPFKFTDPSGTSIERYTVLRLAEQYLIRAEALAMQNNFSDAIADINLIRAKHGGLTVELPVPTSQTACLDIISHERRIELFTEGMHRWIDLKRNGEINAVMTLQKPITWKPTSALYPVPLADLQRNPNLKQNPGYE
jgi:hypothetical protein